MTNPEIWDTYELFDYCVENDLIPEDAEFEEYMYDRCDLIKIVKAHIQS